MKVSVCMTTYNHAEFISEAIAGVLMQNTDFLVELLIGDDRSSDGTSEICRDYASRFPGKIKYIRREENLGMMPNFMDLLIRADGDFIAICEGDDYWIDPDKLQKQVAFLASNPEATFCSHNHYLLKRGEMVPANSNINQDVKLMTTEDYMLEPHFQTASYIFRRSAMPERFPDWFRYVLAGDHFLVLLISLNGKIGFLNERMSVFRTSDTSVTIASGPLRIKENFVTHLQIFDAETDHRFHETVQTVIRRWELVYKPYEQIGYFQALKHLTNNLGFYFRNFSKVGGAKLAAKYLLTYRLFDRIKTKVA
jgi:glycosyltransferase involved in cell wall biosynthesis